MDEIDLISVIVPVYKVEAYLDKCVQSIIDQTYRNLEIILVDDGSPDNCGAMCDAWAEKDSRIKVIHQENKGSGAARNAGLDVAIGKLITFVDSDDYIAPNMYTHLVSLLQSGADIAECGYLQTLDDYAQLDTTGSNGRIYSAFDAMREHIQDRIFRQLIWNKLYRRESIENVRFPENKKIDDEFFTYQVLGNAKKVICSDKVYYAYRQQPNSIMHSMDPVKRLQSVEAKSQRHEWITRKIPELAEESLCSLWYDILYQGQSAQLSLKGDALGHVFDFLIRIQREYPLPSKKPEGLSVKYWIWFRLAKRSLSLTCWVRNTIGIGL